MFLQALFFSAAILLRAVVRDTQYKTRESHLVKFMYFRNENVKSIR